MCRNFVFGFVILGVMFTNDPLRGDPTKIVLNLVDGLGEALVSGQKTPSEVVIDKRDFKILQKVRNAPNFSKNRAFLQDPEQFHCAHSTSFRPAPPCYPMKRSLRLLEPE